MINNKEVGLPAIIDSHTETLIIGTFPSEISRKSREYYANEEKNDFWNTIREKYGLDLCNYTDKLNCLLRHKIGVWDVLASCYIEGSKNKTIRYNEDEDYNHLIETITNSNISKIIINGSSKNKGTKYFFNKYVRYIKKNKGIEIPKNIKIVYLHMQTGQYYRNNRQMVIKEWLQELP